MKKILHTIKFLFLLPILSFMISPAFAASVSFPVLGGGTYNTGQSFSVTVSSNGSEAYNAVEVSVTLNNLTYVGVSGSSNWTAISGPSRSGNTITFAGAILGNSYTGTKSVLTISLKAPSNPGNSSISVNGSITPISNNQKVSGSGSASFTTKTPPPVTTTVPPPPPVPDVPSVSSSTHPDSGSWYESKNFSASWNKQDGVIDFNYVLDKNPNTNLDENGKGLGTSFSQKDLSEGTSYFHIKAKNSSGWGNISHYKVNIDSSNPDPFTVTKTVSGEQYTLYWSTNDLHSGIQKYTLKVDNEDKGEQKSGYQISKNVNNIEVTAYDRVGKTTVSKLDLNSTNQVVVTQIIYADSSTSNTTSTTTLSSNLLAIIFIILSVIFFIYGVVISILYWKKK